MNRKFLIQSIINVNANKAYDKMVEVDITKESSLDDKLFALKIMSDFRNKNIKFKLKGFDSIVLLAYNIANNNSNNLTLDNVVLLNNILFDDYKTSVLDLDTIENNFTEIQSVKITKDLVYTRKLLKKKITLNELLKQKFCDFVKTAVIHVPTKEKAGPFGSFNVVDSTKLSIEMNKWKKQCCIISIEYLNNPAEITYLNRDECKEITFQTYVGNDDNKSYIKYTNVLWNSKNYKCKFIRDDKISKECDGDVTQKIINDKYLLSTLNSNRQVLPENICDDIHNYYKDVQKTYKDNISSVAYNYQDDENYWNTFCKFYGDCVTPKEITQKLMNLLLKNEKLLMLDSLSKNFIEQNMFIFEECPNVLRYINKYLEEMIEIENFGDEDYMSSESNEVYDEENDIEDILDDFEPEIFYNGEIIEDDEDMEDEE